MTAAQTDDDLGPYENEVWKSTLDDRFVCRVTTDERAPYKGRLVVRELVTDDLLVDETVDVAYGARFGPDLDDLDKWQRRCEVVADRFVNDNPTPDPWNLPDDPWIAGE
jgi:hypothetical protein